MIRRNNWVKTKPPVSKWCTNKAQPSLEMLLKIAEVLEVDVKELLWSSREDNATYIKLPK